MSKKRSLVSALSAASALSPPAAAYASGLNLLSGNWTGAAVRAAKATLLNMRRFLYGLGLISG
jgi:citrate synthase